MFKPDECFSLLKRYEKASKDYRKFGIEVLATVSYDGVKYPLAAVRTGSGKKKALIATGVHGDEKAPPEALVRFIEDRKTHAFLKNFSLTLLPLLNPVGYAKDIRKNGEIDLNRHFGCKKHHRENSIIEDYLGSKSFDIMLSLHEDVDMDSFYMYETGSFDAEKFRDIIADDVNFISELKKSGIRINTEKQIYGMLNRGGIKIGVYQKGKNLERYLWTKGIVKRVVCTESPGKIDFEKRVSIQLLAIRHFLKSFIV
jgi:predicted deacylase